MQTFLPYPRFVDCARVLDDDRLGNQRNECYVILNTIRLSTMPRHEKPKVPDGAFWMFGLKNNTDLPWINHPAVRMWKDYRWALAAYSHAIIAEWVARGHKDETRKKFEDLGFLKQTQTQLEEYEAKQKERHRALPDVYPTIYLIPHWLGNPLLHSTHRSKLLEKNSEHYIQFGWDEEPGADYYWPV